MMLIGEGHHVVVMKVATMPPNDDVTSSTLLSIIFNFVSSSYPIILFSTVSDRDLPKLTHISTKSLVDYNRVTNNSPAWWLTVSWSSDRRIALVSSITA